DMSTPASSPAPGTPGAFASPTAPGRTTRALRSAATQFASSAMTCKSKSRARVWRDPNETFLAFRALVRALARLGSRARPRTEYQPGQDRSEARARRRDPLTHGGAGPRQLPRPGA